MRRVPAFVIAGVFVGALCSVAAFTGSLHRSASPVSSGTATLGMRIFGQPPGSGGYFSKLPSTVPVTPLAYNRVFSLHDVTKRYGAFAVRSILPPVSGLIAFDGSARHTGSVLIGSTAISPDAKPAAGPTSPPVSTFQPVDTTDPGVPSLNDASSASLVDDTPSAFDSRLQDSSMSVSMPIRFGAFTVQNINSTAQFTEPTSDMHVHNYTWTAATNFEVRAKSHGLNVNVNTDYEHLNTGSVASFAYNGNSDAAALSDLQAMNPALFAAGSSAPLDLTTQGIGGGVALPLNRRVTLGLQYGAQRFTGTSGLASTPNLDTSKYSYLGNLTFALRPNAALTLSTRQYHYQDNLVPSNNYYQTSTDLNFTVKL